MGCAERKRVHVIVWILLVMIMGSSSVQKSGVAAWGIDGHDLVCLIAQDMLGEAAQHAVDALLPARAGAGGGRQLANWCSWADNVKRHYGWSRSLHFINTPQVCTFSYTRDCNHNGVEDVCLAGAILNYTSQLSTSQSLDGSNYNLTEALFFLAHFMGDIHQPLHVGYADDKGGNTIDVHWYKRKQNLHHVWDTSIIEKALSDLYDSDIQAFQNDIVLNITESNIKKWSSCPNNQIACPNKYAQESINAACKWAYNDAPSGAYLTDTYFETRLPILQERIARAGVRLASILNNLFPS